MAIVDGSLQIGKKDSTWFSENSTVVLLNGQLLYNETTNQLFVGDGVTQLSSLAPFSGGGGSITASNGLTPSGSNIQQGGTFTKNTSFDIGGYNIQYTSSNGAGYIRVSLVNSNYGTYFKIADNQIRATANSQTGGTGTYYQLTNNGVAFYNSADDSLLFEINNNTGLVTSNLPITSTSFIKTGGTSSQFLKADGSSDSNTYQTVNVIVSGNLTASNDTNYINAANATYTDPTPSSDKGFTVYVLNGTATVGGIGYSTVGTLIRRMYHSGSWVTKVSYDKSYYDSIYQASLGYTAEDLYNKTNVVTGNEASTTKYLNIKGYYDYLIGLVWLTAQIFGTWLNGLTAKTTPVDADYIALMDSEDTNKAKKLSWSNIKSALLKLFYNRKIYAYANTDSSVTGTVTETILTPNTFYIEAGDMTANGVAEIVAYMKKTGTAGSATFKIYANSSYSLSGATLIHTTGSAWISGMRSGGFCGVRLVNKNSLSSQTGSSISSGFFDTFSTNSANTLTINTANRVYVLITATLGNTGDTATLDNCQLYVNNP